MVLTPRPEPEPLVTPRQPSGRRVVEATLAPGSVVGGHRIVAPLGQGGMARVYLAVDPVLEREVALKVLPPDEADAEGRARFVREAQALARVKHKNVVAVFASGSDGDVAWMALEYVKGESLHGLCGALDEETALSLCAQVARGLDAAHRNGVVHRDLKPDNLLLDDDGLVRVADFGVALVTGGGRGGFVTHKGTAVGTPHFMAPEQARGEVVDGRADAWGLGATLYALLVGRPPFFGKDDEADLDILARVLRERAPDVRRAKPEISGATAGLVRALLEPDAAARLADMGDIAARLDAIADALAAGDVPAPGDDVGPVADASSASSVAGPAPVVAPAVSTSPPPAAAPLATPGLGAARAAMFVVVVFLVLAAASTGAWVLLRARTATPLGSVDAGAPLLAAPEPVPEPAPNLVAEPAPEPRPDAVPEPPPEPPPPTPVDLASQVRLDPSARGPLSSLLSRDDADARAALALLAETEAPPAGQRDVVLAVVDGVAAQRALHHTPVLVRVLFDGPRSRSLRAVEALLVLRTDVALTALSRAAAEHDDAKVRAAAERAKAKIFSVDPP